MAGMLLSAPLMLGVAAGAAAEPADTHQGLQSQQLTSSEAAAATSYIWKNPNTLKYLYGQTDRNVVAIGKSSESAVTNYGKWRASFNGSYRLYKNVATGTCLDSNASGNVYLRSCSTGNNFQNWQLVSRGGSFYALRNRATGRCLDSSFSGNVYTTSCASSNAYQHWY